MSKIILKRTRHLDWDKDFELKAMKLMLRGKAKGEDQVSEMVDQLNSSLK